MRRSDSSAKAFQWEPACPRYTYDNVHRKLKTQLRRVGVADRRMRGSHTIWTHHLIPEESVTLSGTDGKDAKPYEGEQKGYIVMDQTRIAA